LSHEVSGYHNTLFALFEQFFTNKSYLRSMKRFFNTTGFCNPADHYMVDPMRGILKELCRLIEREQYFLIHAPRQTGKTTLLHALAHQINREGKYIGCVMSVEQAGVPSFTIEQANKSMTDALYSLSVRFLSDAERPQKPVHPISLHNYVEQWSRAQPKPIVLLIDEADSLWDDVMVSFLRQLRDGFQNRPQGFPQSIALVGLRDIREYRLKARNDNPSLGSGSPFNVKSESFFLSAFSVKEVKSLLQQHTADTGQRFSKAVSEKIFEFSGGQPWLTNALANEIVSKMLGDDFSKTIRPDMVETAKERLIAARQTHLDSLADKLKEDRVRKVVMAIVGGDAPVFDDWDDSLRYCRDLGLIKNTRGEVAFANPIYREIITRVLNSSFEGIMVGQEVFQTPFYVRPDGSMDMDKLLQEFQQFYRENSEHWLERFQYKEAGHQLLLMAFLQRIVNGGGRIEREMAVGNGRTDLAAFWKNQVFAMEMKVKRRGDAREKGLVQLCAYLDRLGQSHGYLVLFETKSSEEIPWEQRIKWEQTVYLGKNITVVEM
jgi:DNA polymerase III delta prime subunit